MKWTIQFGVALFLLFACGYVAMGQNASRATVEQRLGALEKSVSELLAKIDRLETELAALKSAPAGSSDDSSTGDDSPSDSRPSLGSDWTIIRVESSRPRDPDPSLPAELNKAQAELKSKDEEYRKLDQRYGKMQEENNRAFNAYQHHDYPYWQDGKAFQKPHGDQELGTVRKERDDVDRLRKRLQVKIAGIEKDLKTLRLEVAGHDASANNAATPATEPRFYVVMFSGATAERVQRDFKPGDKLAFKGKWVSGDEAIVSVEGTAARKAE